MTMLLYPETDNHVDQKPKVSAKPDEQTPRGLGIKKKKKMPKQEDDTSTTCGRKVP